VSKLVQAEIDGCPLSQHEYDVYFLLLAVAGNETTRHSISHGLLALLENPDQLERLRADPDGLRTTAANEILRWATPVHHFRRTATCEVEMRGQTIREDDKVSTWYISGNFDENVFDNPYEFDVGRDPNPHMTFGPGGPHFCTGAHLARLEVELVFQRLIHRVREFEPTGPAERLQSNFFNGIKRMPMRLVPA
jgi:cholest-4-en-3-one 26-monooxygenase